MGLLRGVTFTALLTTYVVGVLAISFNIMAGPSLGVGAFTSVLIGVPLLVSLPVLAYLCTVRDKGGNFVAPSVMVVLLFLSYGLLTGYVLILGLASASAEATLRTVAQGIGVISPILAVALTMLLAGMARTTMVWTPASKRLKAVRTWLYLAPASFFLICQALLVVGRLAE